MLVSADQLRQQVFPDYSVATLLTWARRGVIPFVRVGHRYLFDIEEVKAAVRSRRPSESSK